MVPDYNVECRLSSWKISKLVQKNSDILKWLTPADIFPQANKSASPFFCQTYAEYFGAQI